MQKDPLLAETASSAESLSLGSFCISAEMNFLESHSFGFWQREENSLSVEHCLALSPYSTPPSHYWGTQNIARGENGPDVKRYLSILPISSTHIVYGMNRG